MLSTTNGQFGAMPIQSAVEIMTGAAGTGKTTEIKKEIAELDKQGRPWLVVAPTNRAAKVLRTEHKIPATTIHKGLYKCVKTDEYKIEMKAIMDEHTNAPKVVNGEIQYCEVEVPVYEYTFVGAPSDYTIIIDEASMVPSHIWKDIFERYEGSLMIVGDPNQLLPVENEETTIPEYYRLFDKLAKQPTKHLGSDESNRRLNQEGGMDTTGIKIAIKHITNPKNILGEYPDLDQGGYTFLDLRRTNEIDADIRSVLYDADAIICWTNSEREFLNTLIRKNHAKESNRGYTPYPIIGDHIIADSSYDIDVEGGFPERIISRGDDLIIENITLAKDDSNKLLWVKFKGIDKQIPLSIAHIDGGRVPKELKCLRWIYGYAITCHKAQGSGWKKVVVVDSYSRHEDARRWRYTAATRAREKLIIMKSGIGFDKRKMV
jgi:hypothetical protein